jgi:hypothetical protein
MYLAGAFVTVDYLEQSRLVAGFNATQLSFADGVTATDQTGIYLSGRKALSPDWLPGRLSLRLDLHSVDNDSDGSGTDDVTVVAPMISFLNYDRTLYVDLGYAESSYAAAASSAADLSVEQWTPTIGFGLNEGYDWLQLRAYRIDFSSAERAQGETGTTALELKWTHWFRGRRPLGIDNLRIAVLGGERLYAVDHDAAGVYNLVDRQTGGVSVGAEWRTGDRDRLLLLVAGEDYEDTESGGRYRSASIYLNWHRLWGREMNR